ncbi:uncharacterized protein BCR38DRAFT_462819 [Pseudomassariella vexata]|uniref:Uncharacterized protein n=1 Tax=Pseudomassariella vexata TaxID=1141098 RepID=A0A1Y2EJP3_9PEZI|nr:uncharacterized protein BCR38DRAFT_462819 [Pseudomassariella vexata]ORY71782.1 hypothetical protein BCR38DRAFT_462819 [Pseudomassariella vexata]
MFDVIWTDPNRERVGERIARKELEAKNKDKDRKSQSGRQSVSSNRSSTSDRAFGFFAHKSRKRATAPSQIKERAASSERVAFNDFTDNTKSTLSKWTQPSLATSSTVAGTSPRNSILTRSEHLVQTLGPSSFITKNTEVLVSGRDSKNDTDHLISEIHISADRSKAETPPLPHLPEEGAPENFEMPEPMLAQPPLPQIALSKELTVMCASDWNDRLGNLEAWRPPHDWQCPSVVDSPTQLSETTILNPTSNVEEDSYMSPDLAALQREVRMMAAAGSELMLANMKADVDDATDAMVYKELEMTKKRWMFSALHQKGGYMDLNRVIIPPAKQASLRPPRILAIYETQASASFIAALHPNIAISHLSPNPISPSLFSNIQPIFVPTISSSAASQPLPPRLFSAVTGALHLTLIDPQPVSASMGPILRQWLFDNVLLNLEKESRLAYPESTFPAWLARTRLRGKGSTKATILVSAVPEGLSRIADIEEQSATTKELNCLVMKMLWQEVWGPFVHAKKWWWEEPEITKECAEFGTYWAYSHIIAVRDDDSHSAPRP